MTFPGIISLIRKAPKEATPESLAFDAMASKVWDDVARGLDISQPWIVELTYTRMRRTWRGRRFSYQHRPRMTVRNVETFRLR